MEGDIRRWTGIRCEEPLQGGQLRAVGERPLHSVARDTGALPDSEEDEGNYGNPCSSCDG